MTSTVFKPLTLPNGIAIHNRLCKAAMEEQLAGPGQLPGDDTLRLYDAWAKGGVGLILTGNVMVDRRALTSAGAMVLEQGTDLAPYTRWAQAARRSGAQVWMQINHPGRQVMAAQGQPGWAPSAVAVDLGKHSKLLAAPREMTADEIRQTIGRFVTTARMAQEAGFTGVQVHAAHGYLLSQFLSPLVNQRKDDWGGALENRARLLLEIVRQIRAAVPADFCVSVKLNSADFQRGGFDIADAKAVVQWLNDLHVDLVELSGGNYEAPAMQGQTRDGRTLAREAYFLEFAADIAQVARMPLMVTGGICRLDTAEQVLAKGIAMAGIGTALAMCPDLPQRWQSGAPTGPLQPDISIKDKVLAALATMAMIRRQLHRLGAGKPTLPDANVLFTILRDQLRGKWLSRRYRQWMAKTS